MALTFAIADLHGRFDLLVLAYWAIKKRTKDQPATIVHLGDYIDRGPQSRQIIDFLMDDDTIPPGLVRFVLKGNHEDMMVETLSKPLHPDWWIGNGGGATLISYGHAPKGIYEPNVVPQEHLRWLDQLPTMHVDQHRVYVHAGVDPAIQLHEQEEDVLLWKLYPDGDEGRHGMTSFTNGFLFAAGVTAWVVVAIIATWLVIWVKLR